MVKRKKIRKISGVKRKTNSKISPITKHGVKRSAKVRSVKRKKTAFHKKILKQIRRKLKLFKKKRHLALLQLKSAGQKIVNLRNNRCFMTVSGISLTLFLLVFAIFYELILKDLPDPLALKTKPSAQTTIIRDRSGIALYKVYKDVNRINLDWDEIPTVVKNTTIAIEDSDFYHHPGVSPRAIVRALMYNLSQKNIQSYQGASTITQQLIKNRFLNSRKTYSRKAKEMILALLTERKYRKNEILTMYLNEVGYGGPAYGIEAASEMFFNKPVSDLTLAEAALLAGLPASPTTFSPFGSKPDLAVIRQHLVLDRMLALKMINENQYNEARQEKLEFASQKTDILAPHFVMYVKDLLTQKLGAKALEEGGLDITTTLDFSIQSKAEEVIKNQIASLGSPYNIHNAASLVTDPHTGEILAMIGSVDYFDVQNKGYVNATNSRRQPGSSIKPVNYAYAFDHGFTPNTTVVDAPVVYTAKGSTEIYAPVNYDRKFHGVVTIRNALANSYNIPAVKTLNMIGVVNMLDLGRKMGIRSWDDMPPIGLSLTLGGAEVTMLDMARAYGVIANMGIKKDLIAIKSIKSSQNEDLTYLYYKDNITKDQSLIKSVEAKDNEQVISPLSAYWLTDILSDNKARLSAFGNYSKLQISDHKAAVKTGTSNNFRDNWTIGYSPDYLVATWVGNNDGTFMNSNLVSGITGAAPIWHDIMDSLIGNQDPKDFPVPEGLIPVTICAVNGLLTCPNCPAEKTEYFTADKVPTQKCFFRAPVECDSARAQAGGKSDEEKKQLLAGCPNITINATPSLTSNHN